jgi:hypothetical protein
MAAVDSNSTVNCIAAQLSPTPDDHYDVHLELATKNEATRSLGVVYMDIVIGDIIYPRTRFFVVPDLRDDVILGHEWLEAAKATVCYAQQCVHHGTHRRSTTYWKRTMETTRLNVDSRPLPELQHQFPAPHHTDFLDALREFVCVMDASAVTGNVRAVTHKIRLEKDEPFRIRPYHLNEQKKCALYECINEMLAAGVIERSESEYCSPVVLVKKKDGTVRFCTDYRRLNALTKDEAAPLPRIQEVLRDFGTAQVFSSIDLKSGYWQIPMDPASKHLTAFATPDGATYQYRVMPFGLKNAPATFQKLMTCVLSGLLGKCAHVYLDDIIVFSATYEQHIGHLRQIFERLQEFGLRCAPGKCRFGVNELPYLGHIVGQDGNRPQERHLVQIRDAVPPRTKRQLQSFLGLANWLREYVPLYATIAAPLTDLLVAKKPFRWTDAAQKAFDDLKTAIDQPLLLHRPDASREYVLQTDASGLGVAAVLYQEEEGQRKIISYASARLNDAQRRYHINEQECLAVVFAVKRYRPYLEDKPFLLRTDNKCLLWLNGAKDSNAKLTRWALLLQEFNFRVEHCPGKNNELPDVLSRQPEDAKVPDDAEDLDRMLVPDGEATIHPTTERVCAIDVPTLLDEVKAAQLADPDFPGILERWRRIREEGPQQPGERSFAAVYDVIDGHLVKRDGQKVLLWVPETTRKRILNEFHDVPEAGHPGYEETLRSILSQYTWPTVSRDVRAYVKDCLICATTKRGPIQPGAPLHAYNPERPWQTIAVDYMGPYESTTEGNKYILVVTDLFTRWVEAFPVKGATTKTTVRLLEEEVFCRWGYPQAVITDNGTQFKSNRFKRACHRWRVRHWPTANYHPRANPTERRNQEIKKILRVAHQMFPDQPWDRHLEKGLFNIRRRRNAATGQSPSHLLLGYDLRMPGQWEMDNGPLETTPEQRQEDALDHQRRYRRRYIRPGAPVPVFRPNDLVLVRHHTKRGFEPTWVGPVRVIADARGNCYWIERGAYATREHIDHLRPAPAGHEGQQAGEQPPAEGPEPDREDTTDEEENQTPIIVGIMDAQEPTPPQDVLQEHRQRRHRQQIERQRVQAKRSHEGLSPLPQPLLLTAEISPSEDDEDSTGQEGIRPSTSSGSHSGQAGKSLYS